MASFNSLIDELIAAEGGDRITNAPEDRGGLTKFGISQQAFPNLDIANLTEAEAKRIYKREYWDRLNLSKLPAAMRRSLFFNAVNSGVSTVAKDLQEALNVTPDGIIGPQTIEAAKNFKGDLDEQTRTAQIERYLRIVQNDPPQRKWLNGWINRVTDGNFSGRGEDLRSLSIEEVRDKAYRAAGIQVSEPEAPAETATFAEAMEAREQPLVTPESLVEQLMVTLRDMQNVPQQAPEAPETAPTEESGFTSEEEAVIQSIMASNPNEQAGRQQFQRALNEAELAETARAAQADPEEAIIRAMMQHPEKLEVVAEGDFREPITRRQPTQEIPSDGRSILPEIF